MHDLTPRTRPAKRPGAAGGFHAIAYTVATARRVGIWSLWKAMRSKNACKTCALGMGGQKGGMVNELGHFPEVCKKSLQAMAADMQGALAPRFFSTYDVKKLQALSPRELETSGRLTEPLLLRAGARNFEPVSWDVAMATLATKLGATDPQASFFYFSGRSSNEAGFLLQLMARVYGTNHVNNCSYYCHQASGVGLGQSIGSGTATLDLEDVEHCDVFFLIGGNPASNHPRLMTQLMKVRRRGGKVVVVNPAVETGLVRFRVPSDPKSLFFGTEIASHYLQVHAGGDIAFLAGVAKALFAHHAEKIDRGFLERSTENAAAVEAQCEALDWTDVVRESGVSRQEIEAVAAVYAQAEKAVFGWTMGITHHEHGVENVQWIVNLALLRGMVAKPHAGLLPIRGHSNVQGMGTMGVTPALKAQVLERFAAEGIAVPAHRGYDTMECMEAAHRGEMRVGVCLGGNLYGSNPDARYAQTALANVDLVVYLSTSLNTGHAHGLGKETLILPVMARDEEPYVTTQESMFNFVRISDGGKARHVGPRGEVEIVAELGERLAPLCPSFAKAPLQWGALRSADAIRGWIARLIPGMAPIASAGETKAEFVIAGRLLRDGRFPTASGRAKLFAHPLPQRRASEATLSMMTVRSEGQFNTVVYEEHDYYRGQERRDVILMAAADLRRLGVDDDELVRVRAETGEMLVHAREYPVRAGNALMYYPEANVLVPRLLDPQSRTPAFKAAMVTVTKANPGSAAVPQTAKNGRRSGVPSFLAHVLGRVRRPKLKSC